MNTTILVATFALLTCACDERDGSQIVVDPDGPPPPTDVAVVEVDAAPPDASGPAVFSFEGSVGTGAPMSGRLVVLWVVSSSSPDYVYKFGGGASAHATYVVSFASDPPQAAINSYGIAVGIVALLPPTATVPPDGVFTSDIDDLPGFTSLHAVIYRATTATPLPWIGPFPQGYSCGRCVEVPNDFDGFEPVECSTVHIELAPDDVCNWT